MAKSKIKDVLSRLEEIEKWAAMGLSEAQISFNLGISRSSLENYKKANVDILNCLKRGKTKADFKVENALYKKAIGYKALKVAVQKCKDIYYDDEGRKCQKERLETLEYEEEVQPDVQAIKYWLGNRKSGKWKDNPTKADIDKQVLELKKQQIKNEEW